MFSAVAEKMSLAGRIVAPFVAPNAARGSRAVARAGTRGFPPMQPLNSGMGGPGAGGGGMGDAVHDPEGLLKGVPVREGLIQRRMMQKQMEVDKEFAKAMKETSNELRKEALMRRETRRKPETDEELVEYFLNTVADDLEYEVARYRPRLTAAFFRYMDGLIGAERFSEAPDQDKLGELDLLRKYLAEASEAVDKCVQATSSAKDRLKKLLTAKDKKEMILEMAAANEIDQALMDLLTQNIEAAKSAGQEEPAKFMEKVKQACAKYLVVPSGPSGSATSLPAPPPSLGTQPASPGSVLVTPGSTSSPASSSSAAGVPDGSSVANAAGGQSQQAGGSKLVIPGGKGRPANPNAPPAAKLFI